MTLLTGDATVRVDFDTSPESYRHWRLDVDGAAAPAWLTPERCNPWI